MAPATTVELYCAATAGHTPTRCTAFRARTASLQLVKVVRSGMATGGGPVDTTTPMTEPSLAVTGWPPLRGWGCWLRIRPGPIVMLVRRAGARTGERGGCTAASASVSDFPTRSGTGWLGVKTLFATA